MPIFQAALGDFAYLDEGASKPVLLVHGFASNARVNWLSTGWIDWLTEAGYRVVALDNRGHGGSVKPHDPAAYALEAMAGDVLALADHLGFERFAAIGYSMGARILLELATSHSDRLTHLVLGGMGGAMARGGMDADRIVEALLAPSLETVTDPVGRGYRQFAEQTGSDREALAACMRGYGRVVDPAETARVAVPTLVAVGTRDEVAGSAAELAALIPGAEVLDIPGRDHMRATGDRVFKEGVREFLGR